MLFECMELRITAGTRIGWWGPSFNCVGIYTGPDLGSHLPGTELKQELNEGTLTFKVGVLLRSDLNIAQRFETILILENKIDEMFEYEDWEMAQ